jgi:hypothetical protein
MEHRSIYPFVYLTAQSIISKKEKELTAPKTDGNTVVEDGGPTEGPEPTEVDAQKKIEDGGLTEVINL